MTDSLTRFIDELRDWQSLYMAEVRPLREAADKGEGSYHEYDETYTEQLEALHSTVHCFLEDSGLLPTVVQEQAEDATTDAPTDTDAEGDHWSEDPDYPLRDWRHEVADDNTRLGYWQWVRDRREEQAEESP